MTFASQYFCDSLEQVFEFTEMLQDFHALGPIMALTRNNEIVHERKGEYKNVEIADGHTKMGLAVNEDIDLRISFPTGISHSLSRAKISSALCEAHGLCRQ